MPVSFQNTGNTPMQLPAPGSDAYKAAQSGSGQGTFNPDTQEVSVMSTDGGHQVLNEAIDKHNDQVGALTPPEPGTPPAGGGAAPKADPATAAAMKQIGGVTAEEAKASGTDLTGYSYDSGSGYFLPSNGTKAQQDQFAKDKQSIDAAFSGQMASMDGQTAALVATIQSVYGGRISAQQDINRRELQGFDTTNVRLGTDRYAPGVAQSILTADENEGLKRISAIQDEMLGKVQDAQTALQNKEYTAFMDHRNAIDKLTADYKSNLKDILAAAKDQRDYQLNVQKFQETKDKDAFDSALNTEKERFDEKYKTQQQAIDTMKIKAQYGTNNVAAGMTEAGGAKMNADGTVDKTSQAQVFANMVANFGLATATAIKDVASYNGDLTSFSSRSTGGMNRATVLGLASLYNPNFSQSQYATRQALQTNFASGQYSQTINSLNTTTGHLASLAESSKLLPNSGFSGYNTVADYLSKTFGSASVTKFNTDLAAVQSELATTLKGSGATDSEIEKVSTALSANSSPAQIKAFVEEATSLMGSRLTALESTYKAGMGQGPAVPFLSDHSAGLLNSLKAGGYDVSVEGLKSPVASGIETALQTTNPATGAAYTPQEIVDHLEGDPTYGDKVKEAVSQGISAGDIISYLKTI